MYYLSHGQPHAIFRENLNMLKILQCCGQNGEPINPAVHLETVEDVQPTGKRVNIPSAVRNANYTCVVTSHVASTSATAHLFVTSECILLLLPKYAWRLLPTGTIRLFGTGRKGGGGGVWRWAG